MLMATQVGPMAGEQAEPVTQGQTGVDAPGGVGGGEQAAPMEQAEGMVAVPTGAGAGTAKGLKVPPSVAIACMLLGVLLMAYTLMQARGRKRRTKIADPADERSAHRVGVSYATQTTNQALAELAMQVKRMHGQLRAAHERIEHLEQQGKGAKGGGGVSVAGQIVAGQQPAVPVPAGMPTHGARSVVDPKPASMHVVARANPVHQQVYGLADAGLSPVEIAQATNLPTGQVELILNLRKALGLSAK
jgi:hypothetical protein